MVSVGRCLKDCFEDANGVDANGRAKFICLSKAHLCFPIRNESRTGLGAGFIFYSFFFFGCDHRLMLNLEGLFLADANNYEGLVMPPNKTVQKRQDPPVAPAEVPTPTPLPTSSIPSLPVPELPSTVPSVPTTLPDIPTVTHPSVSSIPPLWSAASPKATAPISATTETVNTCAACATTTLSPSEEATLFLVQSTVLPTTMTAPESPTVVTITSAPQQSPKSYCETTTMTTSITTSMITTGTTTSVTRSGAGKTLPSISRVPNPRG